jgi:hypothetical protein
MMADENPVSALPPANAFPAKLYKLLELPGLSAAVSWEGTSARRR